MVANTKEQGLRLFVYALCEPDGKAIRYVGLTGNLWKRLTAHLQNPHARKVRKWIRGLRERGLIPSMIVLREVRGLEAGIAAETEEIAKLTKACDLLNEQETGRPADKRRHGKITVGGKSLTISQWARELGVSKQAIYLRLERYSPEVALTTGNSKGTHLGTIVNPMPRNDPGSETMTIVVQGGDGRLSHAARRIRREQMADAVRSGKSVEQVAADFRVTTTTVKSALKEHTAARSEAVA